MKANGHDDTATDVVVVAGDALASAADKAGGAWVGSNIICAQIQQLEQQRQAQAAMLRAQIYWQAEVKSYQAEAEKAQAALVEALKAGDYVAAAAAARALSAAVAHLVQLGAE